MRDRAGQVYLFLSGLLFGVVTTAIGAGGGLVWQSAWALLGLVVLYVALAVFFDWPLPAREGRLSRVIVDAQWWSAEVAEFAAEERRRSYREIPHPDTRQRDVDRMMSSSADFMASWHRRFAVHALAAYDRLKELGATSHGEDRWRIEHPTNLLGVEEVSRILGSMAAELEMRHLL